MWTEGAVIHSLESVRRKVLFLIRKFRFWFTVMTYSALNSILHLTGPSWLSARHETQVRRGVDKTLHPLVPFRPVFHLIDWATD